MTASAERISTITSKEEVAATFGESYDDLPEGDPTGVSPRELADAVLTRTLVSEQERVDRLRALAREEGVDDEEVSHSIRRLTGVVRLVATKPLLAGIGQELLHTFESDHLERGGDPELLDGDTIDRGRTSHFS